MELYCMTKFILMLLSIKFGQGFDDEMGYEVKPPPDKTLPDIIHTKTSLRSIFTYGLEKYCQTLLSQIENPDHDVKPDDSKLDDDDDAEYHAVVDNDDDDEPNQTIKPDDSDQVPTARFDSFIPESVGDVVGEQRAESMTEADEEHTTPPNSDVDVEVTEPVETEPDDTEPDYELPVSTVIDDEQKYKQSAYDKLCQKSDYLDRYSTLGNCLRVYRKALDSCYQLAPNNKEDFCLNYKEICYCLEDEAVERCGENHGNLVEDLCEVLEQTLVPLDCSLIRDLHPEVGPREIHEGMMSSATSVYAKLRTIVSIVISSWIIVTISTL